MPQHAIRCLIIGTFRTIVNDAAEVDPKLSTVQRLAVALGGTIEWRFVPANAVPALPHLSRLATTSHLEQSIGHGLPKIGTGSARAILCKP